MLEAVRSKLNDWSTSDNFSDVILSDLEIGLSNQRGVLLLSARMREYLVYRPYRLQHLEVCSLSKHIFVHPHFSIGKDCYNLCVVVVCTGNKRLDLVSWRLLQRKDFFWGFFF